MKIGLCTGCFDVLHDGHRYFLDVARRQCEFLIVAVNDDDWCRANKGPGRPIEPLASRMGAVAGWLHKYAPTIAVIPFNGDHVGLTWVIRPNVIFRGYDQSEKGSWVQIVRIDKHGDFSTTSAAKEHK